MEGIVINTYPNARPKSFANIFEEAVFVFTIMMANASTTFFQGVILINTGTIGRALSMSQAQVAWIAAAIGLTSGSLVLFFGKTADLIGCKIQLVLGTVLLSIFSLAIFFVPNSMGMLVLSGLLGIGTAMVGPPAIGVLLATYPVGKRRNRVTGALGASNPLGFILGSVSSGLSTKYWDWRASFLVIAIFFLVMTTLLVWTVPKGTSEDEWAKTIHQFDFLGAGLMIIGIALISAALTEGPDLGWSSFKFLLMLLIGVFCTVGFGVWETIFPYPLLHPNVWSNTTFSLCVLSVSFGYMSFITNLFWIALYMQDVQRSTSIHIAVLLLPRAFFGVIWSYIGQSLVSKINGALIMAIGSFAYIGGALLLIFVDKNSNYWMILFPSLVLTVIGADFQFIVSNLYVNKQMPTQSSLAAGVLQTGRSLSIPIGLAITFAVYGSMDRMSIGGVASKWAYHRVYLCTMTFAIMSLLFIPFMRIEKQGYSSTTSSIVNSDKIVVHEKAPMVETRPPPPEADGAQDFSDHQKEKNHALAQKPSDGSLASAATAGSYDSYFPRWSWEQLRRWPDDRTKYSAENVVYEVCIKCMQERRVLVQDEKDVHYELVNEDSDLEWDIERQQGRSSLDNAKPVQDYSFINSHQDSDAHSHESMAPSLIHLQNLSVDPYRLSTQSWISEGVEPPVVTESSTQHISPNQNQQWNGNNPYRRARPEVNYDNPVTGERVLFNGYRSPDRNPQPTHQHLKLNQSKNPYHLSLADESLVLMPRLPPPPPPPILTSGVPMSPSGSQEGRIWINHNSTQSIPPPHQINPTREGDSTFEFPPTMSSGLATVHETPRRHKIQRSITSPIRLTTIELSHDHNVEHQYQDSRQSMATVPLRVLNSREMAVEYSTRPMFRRDGRGVNAAGNGNGNVGRSRNAISPSIVNAGGYEQMPVSGKYREAVQSLL